MNTVRRSFNWLIFIGIVISVGYFIRFDIYENDDFFISFFYTSDWWEIIKSADHGRYFSSVYQKLAVHGSSLLQNIHPNDDFVPKFVIGFNIALLTLFISQFSTKPFHKKTSPVMMIITALVLFYLYTISIQNITRYHQHFSYQSNLIFFFFIWGIIGTYFINNTLPPARHLVKNSVLALLLGLSAHFNIFSSIGSIGFLVIYAVVFFGREEDWDFIKIINRFKQLGKGIYIPLLFFVIGIVGYFSAPSFQYLLGVRAPDGNNRFLEALRLLPKFIPQWIVTVFIEKSAILLVLSGIVGIGVIIWHHIRYGVKEESLVLSLDNKENSGKSIRVVVFALALVVGAAFFNGALVMSGKSYYGQDLFWLVHPDLAVLTRMIFFSAVLILVGYIFTIQSGQKEIKTKRVLLILTIFLACTQISFYKNEYKYIMGQRTQWYQTEKIYRFYSLQGKEAILPASISKEGTPFWHNQLGFELRLARKSGYPGVGYVDANYPIVYYKDINYAESTTYPIVYYKDINYAESTTYPTGIPFPKPKEYVSYILTNSNIALQLFNDAGGEITEEELKKPVFDRLFDEDFVLNKKD